MKNLNKLTALTLTAAMAAALAACGGTAAASSGTAASADATAADLLSEIQARGTITIAMEGTWAPWTYHDESDTLVGYDVEVGTKIAEKLGVEPQFVEGEWDGLLAVKLGYPPEPPPSPQISGREAMRHDGHRAMVLG